MDELEPDVEAHYTSEDLGRRILTALEGAGVDVDRLTVDDLAGVDAFHVRGRAATEELARWVSLGPTHTVLDVGSGLGGTARFLADRTGCRVVGIDLTRAFCEVGQDLTRRVGLDDRVELREGSALALPVPDGAFDVVWTEHVQMNVGDKGTFYREAARAVKPGGSVLFHDILAGTGDALDYPMPWASDVSISHLATAEELRARLADAGLEERRWEDRTDASVRFFDGVLARMDEPGPKPPGLPLLMRRDGRTKFANLHRALADGRLRTIQGWFDRPR